MSTDLIDSAPKIGNHVRLFCFPNRFQTYLHLYICLLSGGLPTFDIISISVLLLPFTEHILQYAAHFDRIHFGHKLWALCKNSIVSNIYYSFHYVYMLSFYFNELCFPFVATIYESYS